jgi:murein DD-endopeptidase MepM/ murein hydrolase activator NlpD
MRQTVKELGEAQDAATKSRHAQWRRQVEQDMETARQHLLAQGKEVTQRVDSLAADTVERVKSKIDATRSEAVDRLVTRIRDQVAPMLGVAKDSLQKLQAAENALKKESQTIFAELENQLAISTNRGLDKAHEDLQKNTAALIAKSNDSLQKLFQSFENAARANMNSLLVSAGNQMTKHLQEKAAQVSKEFTDGLEGHTRDYLEAVGKSLADITRKVPTRSGQ